MGTQTVPEREDGLPNGVMNATWFNLLRQVLAGAFVGRNSSTGAPAAGQDLGTLTFPWGTLRCSSLIVNGEAIDFGNLSPASHKVVSGKKRSTSNQPAFLTPAGGGGGAAVDVKGAITPLNIEVSGQSGSITTDVTVSSLATAPASNNTCLLNDSTATSQEETRTWGEPESGVALAVDAMGSEISALIGKHAAFKVVNGANTEYFLAFVESATKLKNAFRGYFYDSALAPINRITIADNNVITLMKLHWLFADTDGTTVASTANEPKFDANTPTGAVTGDYWFDLAASEWKRYDGAAFQTVSRVLIGCVIVDTADCVGARCFDFGANYAPDSSIEIEHVSDSVVQGTRMGQRVSVAGNYVQFQAARAYWDMATDLAGAADMYDATEQSTRRYYFYLKDTGAEVISDISPYFRGDLSGWYHPHNPWRCLGSMDNNGASNLLRRSVHSFHTAELRPTSSFAQLAELTGVVRDGLVSVWKSRTSGNDYAWQGVAWSPELGIFAAVAATGTGNRVMYSSNGISWSNATTPVDNNWRAVTWSPEQGLFVAVANSGTGNRVMTSPNGVNWTARTSAADNNWQSVTWSPELGLFVAVATSGTGNRVMTSPDGITWTIRTSAADLDWSGIAWSPELGLFVAVAPTASANGVMTSPDGITWTIRTSPNKSWVTVAWSPELGIFAAVASNPGTMTSPDGITWTERMSALGVLSPVDMAWSPKLGVFAAVASEGGIVTSDDGITWTARKLDTNNHLRAVTWSPERGLFVAVATSGTGNRVATNV